MTPSFYAPERPVTGPAYSSLFKVFATIVTIGLAAYGIQVALRFPLLDYGFGVKALLAGSALMLGVSYYWFLKSTVTIDEHGIRQRWMYDRKVEWRDIRSAKMIGIPFLSGIFPPRLIVRTGNAFVPFNGGSRDILVEFAKISLAYQMKK
ncbi:hypothetical protein [Noviherbaspirillum galbum]|uniref:Uncharacterized protein n=1 Tax=Noviherbaspirillum galbum TaxID=2709383 RepID=A0A6B3SV29_9BURK|nr:hypothetical protein [Noviherbaspirillum galbum]NEX63235.1 hypothetical protein [Noviherbaspirillum galbum]